MVPRFLRNDTCMYGYSILERVTLEKDGNKRKEAEIVTYNSLFPDSHVAKLFKLQGTKGFFARKST